MTIHDDDLKSAISGRMLNLIHDINQDGFNTGELLLIEDVLLALADSFAIINGELSDDEKRIQVKRIFEKTISERIESVSL